MHQAGYLSLAADFAGRAVDAINQWGIRINNPQVGDIAVWKGHYEIITGVNGEAFNTSGSWGNSGDPIPRNNSFQSSTDHLLKYWGTGGTLGKGVFLGFSTPVLTINKD